MAGILVVFDFDKTIIDCDSDNWVIDELGFTELFNRLLPTMPWNTLMVSFSLSLSSPVFPFVWLFLPVCIPLNKFVNYLIFQDTMMREMHAQGVTIDQIVEVLKRVPIHPRIVPAIKAAHDAG